MQGSRAEAEEVRDSGHGSKCDCLQLPVNQSSSIDFLAGDVCDSFYLSVYESGNCERFDLLNDEAALVF